MGTAIHEPRTSERQSAGPVVLLLVGAAVTLTAVVAAEAAVPGRGRTLAVLLSLAALLTPVALVIERRMPPRWTAVEAPVAVLLASNLVWRGRTTQELSSNPLDGAGLLRVVLVALAAQLALLGLARAGVVAGWWRAVPWPVRLYGLYVLVVFAGAPLSVNPFLTTYRGVELAVALLVVASVWTTLGPVAWRRFERVAYAAVVILVGSVWLGVLLWPGRAVERLLDTSIPIGYNIQGVYPSIAANSTGMLGVLLVVWSLARRWSPDRRTLLGQPRVAVLLAAVGLITLLAAQYRTGYLALLLTLLVWAVVRQRWALLAGAAVLAGAGAFWAADRVFSAVPYLMRGQTTEQAGALSGRVEWWTASLPLWQESPIIGRGLLTGTRFEVFADIGEDTLAGVHSTWVEALVGTGSAGVLLLAGAFLLALGHAVRVAAEGGSALPLVLLTALGVRSVTGNTFESFQLETVVLLVAVAVVSAPSRGGTVA